MIRAVVAYVFAMSIGASLGAQVPGLRGRDSVIAVRILLDSMVVQLARPIPGKVHIDLVARLRRFALDVDSATVDQWIEKAWTLPPPAKSAAHHDSLVSSFALLEASDKGAGAFVLMRMNDAKEPQFDFGMSDGAVVMSMRLGVADVTSLLTFLRDGTGGDSVTAAPALGRDIVSLFEVEKPAMLMERNPSPHYPEGLRSAGVEGEVLAQFLVDTLGDADVRTLRILKSNDPQFSQAVRDVLPRMRFYPATSKGRKVRMIVQQPFLFRLTGPVLSPPSPIPSLWPKPQRFPPE